MPPRSAPTVRQRRLGTELRRLRVAAGVTPSAAAKLLGVEAARLSNIEAGRVAVNEQRIRALAAHYGRVDDELIQALVEMGRPHPDAWWGEYRHGVARGQLDLAEVEFHATALRTGQTSHLPGLLQTADHARVIFNQSVPALDANAIEERISYRLRRQEVFRRDPSMPYSAVIHEAALRMRFGGTATTKRQLRHILDMSEYDQVDIRVLPFSAGEFPGAGQTICYVSGPLPRLDTVQLDSAHGAVYLDSEHDLAKYQGILDRMTHKALDPESSRSFLTTIICDL